MEEIKNFKVTKRDGEELDEVILEDEGNSDNETVEANEETSDNGDDNTGDSSGREDIQTSDNDEGQESVNLDDFQNENSGDNEDGAETEGENTSEAPSFEDVISEKSDGRFKNLDELYEAATKEPEEKENPLKDDYIKKVVDYYNKTGSLEPVLKNLSTDFDKLSDEQIMKRDLREKYPNLSDRAFRRIYEKQVTEKYHLDDDESFEEDIEIGKELLKQDANKKREAWKKQQKEFKAPDNNNSDDQAINKEAEAHFKNLVEKDPATKELMDNKRVVINSEKGSFNFGVENPESIKEMAYDNGKFYQLFSDGNGGVDLNKFLTVASIAQNLETYNKSLINYGQSLGKKGMMSKIKNSKKPDSQGGNTPAGDGEGKVGLLKAFASRGRHT